jgi:hypothetical protein
VLLSPSPDHVDHVIVAIPRKLHRGGGMLVAEVQSANVRPMLGDAGTGAGQVELKGIANKFLTASITRPTPRRNAPMIKPGRRSGVRRKEFSSIHDPENSAVARSSFASPPLFVRVCPC